MAYFLFLVNPNLAYNPYPDWAAWEPKIAHGTYPASRWNTGNRRTGITPGDRGFIVKVGSDPRGLVGACIVTSEIKLGPHWNPEARTAETGYVDIEMREVIDLEDPLSMTELKILGPSVQWAPRQSGTKLPDEVGDRLWSLIFDEIDDGADEAPWHTL